MANKWRLAFMFDAHDGERDRLADRLREAAPRLQRCAAGADLRLGAADAHPDLDHIQRGSHVSSWRTVDAAIEVTVAGDAKSALGPIARAVAPVLGEIAAPASVEVMAGPIFSIVPVRGGGAFLSLAFKRYHGTTPEQFRQWWLNQHAAIAAPVLGEGLLAYDQVHIDQSETNAVSAAFGAPAPAYDAYDNLTWSDRAAFLNSLSDAQGMARIYQDEVGRIDGEGRRFSLMRTLR